MFFVYILTRLPKLSLVDKENRLAFVDVMRALYLDGSSTLPISTKENPPVRRFFSV